MKSPRKGKQKSIDGARVIPTYDDVPAVPVKRKRSLIRKEAPLIKPLRPVPKPEPKPEKPKPEKPKPLPNFSSWNPECISIVGEVLDTYPEGTIVPKETIWEDVTKLLLKGGKFRTHFGYKEEINWILSDHFYRYKNIKVLYDVK